MAKGVKDKEVSGLSTMKLVIIIVVSMSFVFGVAFTGFYFVNKSRAEGKLDMTNTSEKKEIKTEHLDLGEDFVINLKDTGSSRYIKTKIILNYNSENKEFAGNLEKNIAVLRDSTINYFKGKTVEEISDLNVVKKELIANLNKSLNVEGVITDAYFQSLLIQ